MTTYAVVNISQLKRDIEAATSIEELQALRDRTEAIRGYYKKQRVSLDLQNAAAEATLRVERGLGEMLRDMPKNEGNNFARRLHHVTAVPPRLEDIGITKRDSSYWQAIAKLPEETFEQHIAEVKERCEELTTARLVNLAKRNADGIPFATPHISSKNNEWYTPAKYIDAARELMGGIDLDPASCAFANETVKAANYYDITQNGLDKSWTGRVWLNPPYGYTDGVSNQALWSSCLIMQYDKGKGPTTEAVLLVNAAVDTNWFHDLLADYPVCLTRGRINFTTPDPGTSGSTHGSAFVYFGPNPEEFVKIFSEFGTVVRRW